MITNVHIRPLLLACVYEILFAVGGGDIWSHTLKHGGSMDRRTSPPSLLNRCTSNFDIVAHMLLFFGPPQSALFLTDVIRVQNIFGCEQRARPYTRNAYWMSSIDLATQR